MPREPYDSNLFVDRQQILAAFREWVGDPLPPNYLRAITAPAGAGKTWVICHLREELLNMNRCVFMLDLSLQSTSGSPESLTSRLLGAIKEWFHAAQERCCPNIRAFIPGANLEANLDVLVEDLCLNCPPATLPVLLVDGFEEIPEETDRHWIEEGIVKRFLGRSCTRVLIALRDPASIKNSWLRRHMGKSFNLDLLTKNEAREQYGKRGQDILDQLSPLVEPYEFDHPLLNAHLYTKAIERERMVASGNSVSLEPDEILYCLQEMLRPTASDSEPDNLVGLLIQAACLTNSDEEFLDNWSPEEYRNIVGEQYWPRLEPLYQRGLIETNGRLRQVTQGVRQLARAWQARQARVAHAQEMDES